MSSYRPLAQAILSAQEHDHPYGANLSKFRAVQIFKLILICAGLGLYFVVDGSDWTLAAAGMLFGSLISDLRSSRIFFRAWPITRATTDWDLIRKIADGAWTPPPWPDTGPDTGPDSGPGQSTSK